VGDLLAHTLPVETGETVRLVRGSHIVVPALYEHDKCYFLQGHDGRIVFAIPYERDFTLIGTTDADHPDPDTPPECSDAERDYLIDFASQYFKKPLCVADIVWSYSGVRPLYDDGAKSATAATREYVLSLETTDAAVLNVFGGKITTYRRLAEAALHKLAPSLGGILPDWTAGVALPGGDFPVDGFASLLARHETAFPFLSRDQAYRLTRAYGTEVADVLQGAKTADDLGRDFGAGVSERELRWSVAHEFTRTAQDFVWRRSKQGLRLTSAQITEIAGFLQAL
jgi:glycerol-3-phosphate dehydrogenase